MEAPWPTFAARQPHHPNSVDITLKACLQDRGLEPPANASANSYYSTTVAGSDDDWEQYADEFDRLQAAAGPYDTGSEPMDSTLASAHDHDLAPEPSGGGGVGCGGWEKALDIFDAMVAGDTGVVSAGATEANKTSASAAAAGDETPTVHRLVPRARTFNMAIEAARRGNQWERILSLARRMQCAQLRPGADTYRTILAACERLDRWQDALDFLADMPGRGELADARDEVGGWVGG